MIDAQTELAKLKSYLGHHRIATYAIVVFLIVLTSIVIVVVKSVRPGESSSVSTESPIAPEASYANPFDEGSQYVNPFSEYKNPFDSLK